MNKNEKITHKADADPVSEAPTAAGDCQHVKVAANESSGGAMGHVTRPSSVSE